MFSQAGVSGVQMCVATANEAPSAMMQASLVRPLDAQHNSCSGVVDAIASLQRGQFSKVPTQPPSPDWQVVEGGVGETRASIKEDVLVGGGGDESEISTERSAEFWPKP